MRDFKYSYDSLEEARLRADELISENTFCFCGWYQILDSADGVIVLKDGYAYGDD